MLDINKPLISFHKTVNLLAHKTRSTEEDSNGFKMTKKLTVNA